MRLQGRQGASCEGWHTRLLSLVNDRSCAPKAHSFQQVVLHQWKTLVSKIPGVRGRRRDAYGAQENHSPQNVSTPSLEAVGPVEPKLADAASKVKFTDSPSGDRATLENIRKKTAHSRLYRPSALGL